MTSPVIILVAPTGERNIGSAARIMKNFGLADLRLVRPEANHFSRESRRMAMKASDVLERAEVHTTLSDALKDCSLCVATTARSRTLKRNLESLPELFADINIRHLPERKIAFIFGTEESGLSNSDLEYASRLVAIPTSPEYPSLNLAQAVGIVCYEWTRMQQTGRHKVALPSPTQVTPIDNAGRERLLGSLETLLSEIGFINARTRDARMRRLMDAFDRADLSDSDGRFISALFHFVRARVR